MTSPRTSTTPPWTPRTAANPHPPVAVMPPIQPDRSLEIYVDATAELPGMIEILEINETQRALYGGFHRAALDWDGTDPVRVG